MRLITACASSHRPSVIIDCRTHLLSYSRLDSRRRASRNTAVATSARAGKLCRSSPLQSPEPQRTQRLATVPKCAVKASHPQEGRSRSWKSCAAILISLTGALLAASQPVHAAGINPGKAFTNIPGQLDSAAKVPEHLGELLKGKSVEDCARKCITTCIRGGQGSPGLGPISMRKEIIVFKEGFRSRTYCLSECTQVCALMAKMK